MPADEVARLRLIVGDNWVAKATDQLGHRKRLCLPTGRTPGPFYDRLAADSLRETTVFLLDEFGLPVGHPARCDSMIKRSLLDRVPAQGFERPMTEAEDLDGECERYHQLVSAQPLDLAILGLGRNGHLGLNEPGSTIDSKTRRVDLAPETIEGAKAYGADPPATWGVTLGLAEILGAREIWLLVSGRAKSEVLTAALSGPISSGLPASFLQTHDELTVFADGAAGALL